jgi:hypothetical protein
MEFLVGTHENGEMSGRYGKQLLANARWRQECAAKAGIGFALPKGDSESVAILDKSRQVFRSRNRGSSFAVSLYESQDLAVLSPLT